MKETKTGAKAPFGHQLNFFTFIDLCGCFPQKWSPAVSFQEQSTA